MENVINTIYQVIGFEPLNRALYEHTVFNYTNSLGRFSPILRNCYKIGGEMDNNWQYFWS